MSNRLAPTLAVDRAQARQVAVTPPHSADIHRLPTQSHARPALLCHWRLDEETGRPVCGWTIQAIAAAAPVPGRLTRVMPARGRRGGA